MDANTFGGKMIHRDEHGGLTFTGEPFRRLSPSGSAARTCPTMI
jgi:hypothetical protein